MTTKPLRIALTKGRLEKDTVALMEDVYKRQGPNRPQRSRSRKAPDYRNIRHVENDLK